MGLAWGWHGVVGMGLAWGMGWNGVGMGRMGPHGDGPTGPLGPKTQKQKRSPPPPPTAGNTRAVPESQAPLIRERNAVKGVIKRGGGRDRGGRGAEGGCSRSI
jgi:hypothetical protein